MAALDGLAVGFELGEVTVALDETHWTVLRRAAGPAAANPLVAVKEYARLLRKSTGHDRWVNVGRQEELARLPRPGERIVLRCRVAEVFERGGRRFVKVETSGQTGGERILHAFTTLLFRD